MFHSYSGQSENGNMDVEFQQLYLTMAQKFKQCVGKDLQRGREAGLVQWKKWQLKESGCLLDRLATIPGNMRGVPNMMAAKDVTC